MPPKKRAVRGKFHSRHNPGEMRIEVERIKTFKTWSKTCPIEPEQLAEAGFYYVGILDRVKCFSCGGQIEDWQIGDTAMVEHLRMYPYCDMVKNTENNVTIEKWNEIREKVQRETEQVDGQVVSDISTTYYPMTSSDLVHAFCGTSFSHFTGKLTQAKSPDHAVELDRLATFRDKWSDDFKMSTSETRWLANAGFFYTGPNDRARCFFCNGSIECWEEDDEPWSEHAKNFPTCEWLIEMKGQAFVDEVQTAKAIEEAEEMGSKESSAVSLPSSVLQETSTSTSDIASKIVEVMDSPTVKVILKTGCDVGLVRQIVLTELCGPGLDLSSSDNLIKTLWAAGKREDHSHGKQIKSSEQATTVDAQIHRFANLEIAGDPRQEHSQTTKSDPESFVAAKSSEHYQTSTTYSSFSSSSSSSSSSCSSMTASTTGYPSATSPGKRVCMVCKSEDVSTEFLPCRHEVTCLQCARVAIKCPRCATPIKTYRRISDIL